MFRRFLILAITLEFCLCQNFDGAKKVKIRDKRIKLLISLLGFQQFEEDVHRWRWHNGRYNKFHSGPDRDGFWYNRDGDVDGKKETFDFRRNFDDE